MYMEFVFTSDPAAMMDRIAEDIRLERIANQGRLLRSVVNTQFQEFHEG